MIIQDKNCSLFICTHWNMDIVWVEETKWRIQILLVLFLEHTIMHGQNHRNQPNPHFAPLYLFKNYWIVKYCKAVCCKAIEMSSWWNFRLLTSTLCSRGRNRAVELVKIMSLSHQSMLQREYPSAYLFLNPMICWKC